MEIDKNVALPIKVSKFADKMVAGDSILFETKAEAMRLRDALRWRNRKYASRKIEGGYRVWCLSNKED